MRLAVLFGSFASGRERPESDVDIAIEPTTDLTLADEMELASALSRAVKREVDLVRIDRADPLLGREIARNGIPIIEERAGAFAAYRARAIAEWIDFDEVVGPFQRKFLERLARSGAR
ncbi:hypothetical protein BH09MYX1_BH09MYX1_54910 [soil metagenome]